MKYRGDGVLRVDTQRMRRALDSVSHEAPVGLSREEKRQRIRAVARRQQKESICSLFDVYADDEDTRRIVTPLEYPGSNDRIVVRVRPLGEGSYQIDDNGEAALYATLNGGDVDSDSVMRWSEEQERTSPASFDPKTELISAFASDECLVAPYILWVAQGAQQLYTLATARQERRKALSIPLLIAAMLVLIIGGCLGALAGWVDGSTK